MNGAIGRSQRPYDSPTWQQNDEGTVRSPDLKVST
jgi:hypothetical protein